MLAGLFASYFDVIFAINRELHLSEKRLIALTATRCEKLPLEMAADIETVLRASTAADDKLITRVTRPLDHLDELLGYEGFDPGRSQPKASVEQLASTQS